MGLARENHFSHFLLAYFSRAEAKLSDDSLICTNWPDRLYRQYVMTGHFGVSEFVARSRETVLPVGGTDLFFPVSGVADIDYLRHAFDDYGLSFSVGLTLCDCEQRRYAAILSRKESCLPYEDAKIVYLAMDVVDRLALSLDEANSGKLSNRERECLTWVAAGKSSIETGVILKISPHTVNGHVKSAMVKLNVVNRMQAVATACRLRII